MAAGFDIADNEIFKRVATGNLVITADILIALEILIKDSLELNSRSDFYQHATIREKMTLCDFMDTLCSSGIDTGSPLH